MTTTKGPTPPVGMTCAEAGRKGGASVFSKRGRAFYEAIGKKGGDATKAAHGHDYYVGIGKLGGPKGGAATRDMYAGTQFYEKIGKMGGAKVKAVYEAGKAALAAQAAADKDDAA